MRCLVIRRLTQIQYSDNIFTNFEQYQSTLRIEADKKLAEDNLFSRLRFNKSASDRDQRNCNN